MSHKEESKKHEAGESASMERKEDRGAKRKGGKMRRGSRGKSRR